MSSTSRQGGVVVRSYVAVASFESCHSLPWRGLACHRDPPGMGLARMPRTDSMESFYTVTSEGQVRGGSERGREGGSGLSRPHPSDGRKPATSRPSSCHVIALFYCITKQPCNETGKWLVGLLVLGSCHAERG